ncbi:hypothetical protein WA026_001363 [Henosepilachna vigintioctopunctata]|uniref:Uncharacterized protein n=1 Tax=Henosepilachna vigintioctopunctata TaxID=420089 RepID=A0AAW1UKA9_9CUCU
MSILNYSVPSPFFGTPNPSTHYHHPPQPSLSPLPPHPPPYHYPHPDKPFLEEEYPPPQYRGHKTTPQHAPPGSPTNTFGYPTGTQSNVNGGTPQIHQNTQNGGHPDIDYDYQDEYTSSMPSVTPIQGPIFVKNGTVPVVPLYSYPVLNNGTLVQIPKNEREEEDKFCLQ